MGYGVIAGTDRANPKVRFVNVSFPDYLAMVQRSNRAAAAGNDRPP
jgi:hypothetical protein